jgi:hypothetical protein
MLLDVVQALESAGAKVRLVRRKGSDAGVASLTLDLDGAVVELEVEERRRSPNPADVAKLARPVSGRMARHRPMLVAPFISPSLGDALIEAGWSWADAVGNFDIKAPRFRLRQRLVLKRPPRQPRELPGGAGSIAIQRWLLSKAPLDERIVPSVLTEVGRVSQPRVSQILQALARLGLLVRERGRYRLPAVDPLLDAFLRDYRGPGGSQRFAYTLDPPSQFAAKATDILGRAMAPDTFAISADVGPDLLSPWRKPTHVVVYASESIALDSLGLVGARGREDANVLLRMPTDASVFATLAVRAAGSTAIPLVDVPQMMWDLLDLGGEDREEAAGRLREWFIQHRQKS